MIKWAICVVPSRIVISERGTHDWPSGKIIWEDPSKKKHLIHLLTWKIGKRELFPFCVICSYFSHYRLRFCLIWFAWPAFLIGIAKNVYISSLCSTSVKYFIRCLKMVFLFNLRSVFSGSNFIWSSTRGKKNCVSFCVVLKAKNELWSEQCWGSPRWNIHFITWISRQWFSHWTHFKIAH